MDEDDLEPLDDEALVPPPGDEGVVDDNGEIVPPLGTTTPVVTPPVHQARPEVNLGRVGDPREPDISNVGWTLKVEALMRAGIAYTLLAFFGLTIVWSFIYAGTHSWKDTQALLQVILPVETALLGSAVGYYFGTHKSN